MPASPRQRGLKKTADGGPQTVAGGFGASASTIPDNFARLFGGSAVRRLRSAVSRRVTLMDDTPYIPPTGPNSPTSPRPARTARRRPAARSTRRWARPTSSGCWPISTQSWVTRFLRRVGSLADPGDVPGGSARLIREIGGVLRRVAGRPTALSATLWRPDDARPTPALPDRRGSPTGLVGLLGASSHPGHLGLQFPFSTPGGVPRLSCRFFGVDGQSTLPGVVVTIALDTRGRIRFRWTSTSSIGSRTSSLRL